MKYKVSVIVPVYNVEDKIARCLESLVNQTLKNIEIIVVNDGTKDNSQDIIDLYKNRYSNVKSYIKENGGLSDARNYGLKKATGDYVLFVDSDDYIDINACEVLYNEILKNDLDVLIGNYYTIRKGKSILNINKMDENVYCGIEFIKKYFLLETSPIMAWLFLCKRKYLLNNKLFFKKEIYHEDEELMPTVIFEASKIKYINYAFYYYVISDNSITTKKDKTKNIIDIYNFTDKLEERYRLVSDKLARKLLLDRLVNVRLLAFAMQSTYDKKFVFQKRKILGKSYKLKNKIRTFIYCLSPCLYYKVVRIKNGDKV